MNNSPYRDGTEAEGYVGKKTCFGLVRDEDYWKVEFLHTDEYVPLVLSIVTCVFILTHSVQHNDTPLSEMGSRPCRQNWLR